MLLSISVYSDDSIIAIYEFDNTEDSSNNQFHGDLVGDAKIGDGKFGNGLQVEDTGAFFTDIDDMAFSVKNNFSIIAWFKTENEFGTYIIRAATFDENDRILGNMSIRFYGNRLIDAVVEDQSNHRIVDKESLMVRNDYHDDKWHHIAISASDEEYRIYIDGKFKKGSTNDRDIGFSGPTTFIQIGNFGSRNLQPISFDDVGFFRRGLSEREIQIVYKRGLSDVLKALSVPSGNTASTWGNIKSDNH